MSETEANIFSCALSFSVVAELVFFGGCHRIFAPWSFSLGCPGSPRLGFHGGRFLQGCRSSRNFPSAPKENKSTSNLGRFRRLMAGVLRSYPSTLPWQRRGIDRHLQLTRIIKRRSAQISRKHPYRKRSEHKGCLSRSQPT